MATPGRLKKDVQVSSTDTLDMWMWADDPEATAPGLTPVHVLVDGSGTEIEPALEATLQDVRTAVNLGATEETLSAVRSAIQSVATTVAVNATEATLQQARNSLAAIAALIQSDGLMVSAQLTAGDVYFDTTGLAMETGGNLEDIKTAVAALAAIINASELKVKDAATLAAIQAVDGHVDGLEALHTTTNSTLAAIQSYVDGLEGAFSTLNAKDFATQTTLAALNGKDFATQTTLASVNSAISDVRTAVQALSALIGTDGLAVAGTFQSDPPVGMSTEAKQDVGNSSLSSMDGKLTTLSGYVDGLEGLITSTNSKLDGIAGYVDGLEAGFSTLNAKDFATQTTLAAILAKILSAPATEAKQDTANTALSNIASYVDGLEGAFTTLNAKDFATQTTLASMLSVEGATSGAAVITDANGTIQQYLRGLVKQWIAGTLVVGTGENHIGEVGGKTSVYDLTLSLDTGAYASGEVLAATQQADAFFRKADGTGVIQSIQVIDKDDQKAALTIVFLSANVAMGSENSSPSLADADSIYLLGHVAVATTDYIDWGGVSTACIRNIGLPVKAVSGTDDLYVAVINGSGAPTYTASGVVLRIGALLD